MKRILLVLAALLALVMTAWLAPLLLDDPGYVMIDFGPWRLEMSVLVLVGLILVAWAGVSLIFLLARLPGRTWRRIREARHRRHLDNGLLALTEGDWEKAEKSLAKALSGRPSTAGYLAAARAAQGQAAGDRRDRWLALADGRFGKRHFATALARTRLLAAEGRLEEAVPILEDLHVKKPRHAGVLRLLLQAYQESDRWHELRMLVPPLRRAGIVSAEKAEELAGLAAGRELDSCLDTESLQASWGRLGRRLRRRTEVTAAYARRALELDRTELGEPELRRALEREKTPELLALYAEANDGDRRRRIRHCEGWLEGREEDPDLNLTLGRLYLAEHQHDKARACLEKVVRTRPDAAAYAALGRLLDRAGELEAAAQCYRNALRLEHGRAAEPLPPPGG